MDLCCNVVNNEPLCFSGTFKAATLQLSLGEYTTFAIRSQFPRSDANVASSFFGAKFQRNIEELLVAPVPTHVIIAGYVGGGVARGLFVGILVTAISLFFVPFQVHSWVFVALTLVLTAVLFSLAVENFGNSEKHAEENRNDQ